MELEFDKEMDVLMRKAAGSRGVLIGDTAKLHLDADALTAFAENALPEKSRRIYTQHLAECDPCRKTLSNLITLNAAAEPAMAAPAAPVAAASIPWYRKLFAAPNLAYTFGALILVFGGLLGVIVLQNSYLGDSATVLQVEDKQEAASAPARADSSNTVAFAANANSNTSTNAAGEIPQSMGVAETGTETDATTDQTSPPAAAPMTVATPSKGLMLDGTDKAAGQAAPAKDAPKSDRDEARLLAKAEDKKVSAEEQQARKQAEAANEVNVNQQQQTQLNQMTPDTSSAKKASGPSRADVTRDNRSYDDSKEKARRAPSSAMDSVTGSGAKTRSVSGKTFELKQGAWYDTAYRGQRTTNVRRGTDEYRKLDGGLRNIADNIRGTVVVVWKEKAYRIQ